MDKISVMICDDSALMRNLFGRIITEIDGFEIAGKAENGQVCLSMIEEKKPDVILLDVEMPVMNGIEFLKKRRELGLDIPVIMLGSDSILHSLHPNVHIDFILLLPFRQH